MSVDIHALSGAYVLDAVSDLERAAFNRHLAGCESCAVEVAELREGVARLADATWSVPPPRLREQVLTRVRQTRQLAPGRPESTGRSARSRWRRTTAAAVAAGILAVGAGAVTYTIQEQRVRDERANTAAARAETARIQAVLGAPDAIVRTTEVTGGGRITVVSSQGLNAGVALLNGLAEPGAGRAYQLWLIEGSTPASAGVLAAGQTGASRLIDGVRGADLFGITIEPAGGSNAPTMDPIAGVALT